jgi:serine/threonine protein kinase
MSEARQPDWVGRIVDGRYRILSILGTGGMGVTYLASDERQFARSVAIKVPHEEYLTIRHFRERFDTEIKQLSKFEHPHIVKLYDSGQSHGVPYAVLQYLPGGSLRDRIKAAGGTLEPAAVLQWLPRIAEALDFIHGSILHRDVKPDNVLFDAQGHVYLSDFGIVKVFIDPMFVTSAGHLPGAAPYMAPEAAAGRPLGPTYDQYSLAVVLFEALSGRLPHEPADDRLALLVQKATRPPRQLRDVAPGISQGAVDAVMRALSPDPSRRFGSCKQLSDAFAEGLSAPRLGSDRGAPVHADAAGRATAASLLGHKSVAGAILLGLAGVLLWSYGSQPTSDSDGAPNIAPSTNLARDIEIPAPAADPGVSGALVAETSLGLQLEKPALPVVASPPTVSDKAPVPETVPEAAAAVAPILNPGPDPDQARRRDEQIRTEVLRADDLLERADYDGAVRGYQAVLALDPYHPGAQAGIQRANRAQAAETRVLSRLK